MRRVSVVGNSGAGKSRFAQRLAAELGAPWVELDAESLRRPPRRACLRVQSLAPPEHFDEPLDTLFPRFAALGGLYSVKHAVAVSASEVIEGLLSGWIGR